jgi:hypothetical protein
MPADGSVHISDFDRDSLFTLPLAIIPLKTSALRQARMIKNARLESVIELFDEPGTGSGQLDVEGLASEFEWSKLSLHPDHVILRKLASLPSFDVYSLRVSLRQLGIEVNDVGALRLSARKINELTVYMRAFTQPLIQRIYGSDNVEIQSFDSLIALFRDPNVERARSTLRILADTLRIDVNEIPRFLEDYGDIFLSLSYYRHGLDYIAPIIDDVLQSLKDLRTSWHARSDPGLLAACTNIEDVLNETTAAVTGRLEAFDRSSKSLWQNVSASRFREVETLVRSCHTTIGGQLCALTVKMEAWAKNFPSATASGPVRRAKFIMGDMRQGIETLRAIETSAPKVIAVR